MTAACEGWPQQLFDASANDDQAASRALAAQLSKLLAEELLLLVRCSELHYVGFWRACKDQSAPVYINLCALICLAAPQFQGEASG